MDREKVGAGLNYYKRKCDETTGEALTDLWGTSIFFLEAAGNRVVRQLQVFENGKGLRYWEGFMADGYGMLADQTLDSHDFETYRIEKNEFERTWAADYRKQISVWNPRSAENNLHHPFPNRFEFLFNPRIQNL